MGRVALHVPHMSGESPTSFMSRLAARNGIDLVALAGDMNIPPTRVADGSRGALAALARLGEVSEDALRADGFAKADAGWTYRGEILSRNTMRRRRVFVCARCLLDDAASCERPQEAMYGRTIWMIDQVKTCAKHDIALTAASAPPNHPVAAWDFVDRVRPILADLPRIAVEGPSRKPSGLERYLLRRLDGRHGGGWLDELPFHVAAETCEWVGSVALYGPRTSRVRLTEDDRHAAGDAGHEIASQGEAGFAAFSAGMRATIDASKANTDGQKVFGHFWWFLQKRQGDDAFAPVRKMMVDLMAAAKPVASGSTILGVSVEDRKVHSIRTGSLESGLHANTLRAVLEREGVIGKDQTASNGLVTVEADHITDVMHRLKHSMNYKDAMDYLNAPRHAAWGIYKAGIVSPRARMHDGSHNKTFYLEFAKPDLDAFLGALLDGAEDRENAGPGEVDIRGAARQNFCGIAEVVTLILQKRLPWVGRLRGARGFMSVLVRKDDVAPLVKGADPAGMTEGRVRHHLRAHDKSVPVLIEEGLLSVIEAKHPRTRALQRYVTSGSLERFEAEYVTLSKRAVELGMNRTLVRARLLKEGIGPALPADRYHSAFFRRSELPDRI